MTSPRAVHRRVLIVSQSQLSDWPSALGRTRSRPAWTCTWTRGLVHWREWRDRSRVSLPESGSFSAWPTQWRGWRGPRSCTRQSLHFPSNRLKARQMWLELKLYFKQMIVFLHFYSIENFNVIFNWFTYMLTKWKSTVFSVISLIWSVFLFYVPLTVTLCAGLTSLV
jgi:hypothetical protein